jgi:hypothetical protein
LALDAPMPAAMMGKMRDHGQQDQDTGYSQDHMGSEDGDFAGADHRRDGGNTHD